MADTTPMTAQPSAARRDVDALGSIAAEVRGCARSPAHPDLSERDAMLALADRAEQLLDALKYAANSLTAMRPSFAAVKNEGHAFHDQVIATVNSAIAKAEA